MAKDTGMLTELEQMLSALIQNNTSIICRANRCKRLPAMASAVSESIFDALYLDWQGIQLYFPTGTRQGIRREGGNLGERLILEVEERLYENLQGGVRAAHCADCALEAYEWAEIVPDVAGELYASVSGQQGYISTEPARRNKLIQREFTGNNVPELVRKFHVSTKTVYDALAQARSASAKPKEPRGTVSQTVHAAIVARDGASE